MEILNELFLDWKLDIWANVLEVIGFVITVVSLLIAFRVKSEVTELRQSYILDKRIDDHIKNINQFASELNTLLNNYNQNRNLIRTEIGKCQSELEDLYWKLGPAKGKKTNNLIKLIKARKSKPFIENTNPTPTISDYLTRRITGLYKSTYEDVWNIYNNLKELGIQIDNFKKNKKKSI